MISRIIKQLKNNLIETLYLEDPDYTIYSKNDINKIFEALKYNTSLKSLIMCDVDIEDISILSDSLKNNHSLIRLKIFYNRRCNDISCFRPKIKNMNSFYNMLKYNDTLKILELYGNLLDNDDVNNLFQNLKFNKTLKQLGLNYNHISNVDILKDFLKVNSTLVALSFYYNGIHNIDNLCEGLKYNSTLTHLFLGDNYIETINSLCEILKSNSTSLNHLDLSKLNDADDLKEIFDVLKYNTTLNVLNLEENKIENIDNYGEILLHNSTLKELKINGYKITNKDKLNDYLKSNNSSIKLIYRDHY